MRTTFKTSINRFSEKVNINRFSNKVNVNRFSKKDNKNIGRVSNKKNVAGDSNNAGETKLAPGKTGLLSNNPFEVRENNFIQQIVFFSNDTVKVVAHFTEGMGCSQQLKGVKQSILIFFSIK